MGKSKLKDEAKKLSKTKIKIIAGAVGVLLIAFAAIGIYRAAVKEDEKEPVIITASILQKTVDISELDTYKAVYNGIATVMNEKKPEKVDYYVSYKAVITAGLDFNAIAFDIDNENRQIRVTLPEIKLTPEVDITSLDYMFINKKIDKLGITAEAFEYCNSDIEGETENNEELYKLAAENAQNIVKALVQPYLQQINADTAENEKPYEIVFNGEEEK